jgi:hypothetical protein
MDNEPDDSGFDPNSFYATGPLWVLENKAAGKVGYAGGRTSKARYLFIFTDLHLAEKYLEDGGAPGFVPRQVPSKEAYASFLESVRPAYDRVAYDPPAGGRVRISFDIAEVINDARRDSGDAET